MKLELKHLAPYLPYELKVKTHYGNRILDAEYNDDITISLYGVIRTQKTSKPILRPLSDLSKDEYYNNLCYNSKTLIIREDNLHYNWRESMPYFDFIKLLEWHFDVFGLIPKGLAIDINTL